MNEKENADLEVEDDGILLDDWIANPDPSRLNLEPISPQAEKKPVKKASKATAKKPVSKKDSVAVKRLKIREENARKLEKVLALPPELQGTGKALMAHARAAGARLYAKEIFNKTLGHVDKMVDDETLPMEHLLRILDVSGKYGLGTKIEVSFGQHELLAVLSRIAYKYIPDPEEYERFARECFAALQETGFDKAMGGEVIEASFQDQSVSE